MMNKFVENCKFLKELNAYHIVENFVPVVLNELDASSSKKLAESVNKEASSNGIRFLIWDDNFNLNGRNYRDVIPRVIEENKKTLVFANHPNEDEPDLLRAIGVAGNPRLESNGWLSAEFVPICEDGEKIVRAYKEGAGISVSSSVYGNVDDYGFIINDNTFMLDRWFDIVYNPSNRIVHYNDGHIELKESVLSNNDKHVEYMECETMDEKFMVLNVKAMIKEAQKIQDVRERKVAFNEAIEYADSLSDKTYLNTIKTEIDNCDKIIEKLSIEGEKIESLNEEINIKEKNLIDIKAALDSVNNENKELKEKISLLETSNVELNEKLNTVSKLYENINGDIEKSNEKIATYEDVINKMNFEAKILEAKYNTNYVSVEKYVKDINECKETIKSLRKKLIDSVIESSNKKQIAKKENIEKNNNDENFMQRVLGGDIALLNKINSVNMDNNTIIESKEISNPNVYNEEKAMQLILSGKVF